MCISATGNNWWMYAVCLLVLLLICVVRNYRCLYLIDLSILHRPGNTQPLSESLANQLVLKQFKRFICINYSIYALRTSSSELQQFQGVFNISFFCVTCYFELHKKTLRYPNSWFRPELSPMDGVKLKDGAKLIFVCQTVSSLLIKAVSGWTKCRLYCDRPKNPLERAFR